MSPTTIAIVLAVAVVLILILRAKGESNASPMPSPPLDADTKPDVRQIAQLMLQGRRVEAIKAYMDLSGASLEDAKNAVERYDPLLKKFEAPSPPSFGSITDWTEIDELLEAGDKISAIKLYRLKTRCDLKEAKDAIDIRDNPS